MRPPPLLQFVFCPESCPASNPAVGAKPLFLRWDDLQDREAVADLQLRPVSPRKWGLAGWIIGQDLGLKQGSVLAVESYTLHGQRSSLCRLLANEITKRRLLQLLELRQEQSCVMCQLSFRMCSVLLFVSWPFLTSLALLVIIVRFRLALVWLGKH